MGAWGPLPDSFMDAPTCWRPGLAKTRSALLALAARPPQQVAASGICAFGEKCRVVKPGEVHRLAHCSAEELAAKAARKGDATDSGGMLCAPPRPGDRVIEVLGVGNRLWAPPSAMQSGCGMSPA